MANVFDYIFNIGGNFSAQINGITDATGKFEAQVEAAQKKLSGLNQWMASFEFEKNEYYD